jgi:hypothetical protein
MSLAEMGRVLRRRWYVLLPLLILAGVLTAGVDLSIPKQYQSTGMVSLLASQQSTKGTTEVPGTGNPFLSFDSSLNDTADFLVRNVEAGPAAQQLAAQDVTDYSVALAASQGPFIELTTDGKTPAAARSAMTTLIAFTGQQLQALQQQQGVPPQDMITSAVIVPPGAAVAQNKKRIQDTLGAAAAGLALALLVTMALDSLGRAGRRRRGRSAPARRPAAAAFGQDPSPAPAAGLDGGPDTERIGPLPPLSEVRD